MRLLEHVPMAHPNFRFVAQPICVRSKFHVRENISTSFRIAISYKTKSSGTMSAILTFVYEEIAVLLCWVVKEAVDPGCAFQR